MAAELRKLGFTVTEKVGGFGVVGVLKNGPGPTVLVRTDTDALPVTEKTGLPYASTVRVKRADGVEVPVAHMCGHDAHVTWMLGVAKVMADMRGSWKGTLILVAQPAEELIAGAVAMVDDGLYTRHQIPVPDYLIALHSAPIPTGTIASVGGIRQAGTDQLDVVFHGVGVHGSTPQLGKDPVVMAATAIMQYQTIVSRAIDPLETAVLTVGAVQAGTDNNVIPDKALLKLNLRYFSQSVREQMLAAIRAINTGVARSAGMPEDQLPTITMKGRSDPLVNDTLTIARLNRLFEKLPELGPERLLTSLPRVTGSEDAHMLVRDHPRTKVAYLVVGIAEPARVAAAQKEGKTFPFYNHNPGYTVDLASIPLGTRIAALTVLELLSTP